MRERHTVELEMLPDGRFRQTARPPIATRIFMWALVIAIITGALAAAAFALWIALILIPVALAAAVLAWLAMRFQMWRARRSFRSRQNAWQR